METLKDFEKIIDKEIEVLSNGDMYAMGYPLTIEINKKELLLSLKREAIKWIKELKKRDGKENSPSYLDKPFGDFSDSGYDEYASHPFVNVIAWIKHFFNITEKELEEDLK